MMLSGSSDRCDIRSLMRVYRCPSRRLDLIAICCWKMCVNAHSVGELGSGAEINAGGSIHVYGTLRERALAGTAGDCAARIFCRSFHAELMAINGYFRVADNLDPSLRGRPIQARLEGLRMTLNPLNSE